MSSENYIKLLTAMKTPDSQRIKNVMFYLQIKSVNALAQIIGIQRQNLYDIEKGKRKILLLVAKSINEKYPEIQLEWLLNGKGEMLQGKSNEKTKSTVEEKNIKKEKIIVEEPKEKYKKCERCKELKKDKEMLQLLVAQLKKELDECKKLVPEEKRKAS